MSSHGRAPTYRPRKRPPAPARRSRPPGRRPKARRQAGGALGLAGLVPPAKALPDVLPPTACWPAANLIPLRSELQRVPNVRKSTITVAIVLVSPSGVIAWRGSSHPLAWVAIAFLLMGRAFALCAILAHR